MAHPGRVHSLLVAGLLIALLLGAPAVAQTVDLDQLVGTWGHEAVRITIAKDAAGRFTLTHGAQRWAQAEAHPGELVRFVYTPTADELPDTIPPPIKAEALQPRDDESFQWEFAVKDIDVSDTCKPSFTGFQYQGTIKWKRFGTNRFEFVSATSGGTPQPKRFEMVDQMRLCGLQAKGLFADDAINTCPARLPSIGVDGAGHYVVSVPKGWLAAGTPQLTLLRIDDAQCPNWREVTSVAAPPTVRDTCATFQLDRDDPSAGPAGLDVWSLDEEKYQVLLQVKNAAGTPVHGYLSPPFTRDDINAAMYQRLESLSRYLVGLDFNAWRELHEADADAARRLLWKELYGRGEGYSGSISVANLFPASETHAGEIAVNGVFAATPALQNPPAGPQARRRLSLSSRPTADVPTVAPQKAEEVAFGPFNLDPDPLRNNLLQQALEAIEIVGTCEGREQKLRVTIERKKGFAEPEHVLALAMRTVGGLKQPPAAVRAYEAAVDRALAGAFTFGGEPFVRNLRAGKASLEDKYARFLELAERFPERLKTTDAGIAAIDTLLRRLCRERHSITIGTIPMPAGPGLTTPAGDPNWRPERGSPFRLETPGKLLAVLGKLVNPEAPSYSQAQWVTGDNGCGAPPPGTATAPPSLGPAGTAPAPDPRLAAPPGPPGVPDAVMARVLQDPALVALLRSGPLNIAKGELHEAIAFERHAPQELDRAIKANPELAGRIVALRGGQGRIWAPDLFGVVNTKLQYSDGLVFGTYERKEDGQFRFRVARIFEAKSGQFSTDKLAEQLPNDVLRGRQGVGFLVTDAERQQLKIGLQSTAAYTITKVGDRYAVYVDGRYIDGLDPRANPNLFRLHVPAGVTLPRQIELKDSALRRMDANDRNPIFAPGGGTLIALKQQLDEQHTTRAPYDAEQLVRFVNGHMARERKYAEERAYFQNAKQRVERNAKVALGLVLAQKAGAAAEEYNALKAERLLVDIRSNGKTTYVTVVMEIDGQRRPLRDNAAQRTMLEYWYRQAAGIGPDQPVPAWLRGSCN